MANDSKILATLAELDTHIREGIKNELREQFPALEASQKVAASELAESFEALEVAKSQLAEMDSKIAEFREGAAENRAKLDDEDPHNQVVAKMMVEGFENHITKLLAHRDQMASAMIPVENAYTSAQGKLARANERIEEQKQALDYPYLGLGIETEIFRAYRAGSWGQHLLALQDQLGFEQQSWEDAMDAAATNTGYSTKGLEARIREAEREQARRDMNELFPESASSPTGQDVREGIHGSMERQWMSKTVEQVVDVRPVTVLPIPPREHLTLPHRKG